MIFNPEKNCRIVSSGRETGINNGGGPWNFTFTVVAGLYRLTTYISLTSGGGPDTVTLTTLGEWQGNNTNFPQYIVDYNTGATFGQVVLIIFCDSTIASAIYQQIDCGGGGDSNSTVTAYLERLL